MKFKIRATVRNVADLGFKSVGKVRLTYLGYDSSTCVTSWSNCSPGIVIDDKNISHHMDLIMQENWVTKSLEALEVEPCG